jgi:hypothetical protein
MEHVTASQSAHAVGRLECRGADRTRTNLVIKDGRRRKRRFRRCSRWHQIHMRQQFRDIPFQPLNPRRQHQLSVLSPHRQLLVRLSVQIHEVVELSLQKVPDLILRRSSALMFWDI